MKQLGPSYPLAAVVSSRDPKELDARTIAQALRDAGQIPEGFRVVRVAKVQLAKPADAPDGRLPAPAEPPANPPEAKPAQPAEVAADPFRDDAQHGSTPPSSVRELGFEPIGRLTIDTTVQRDPKVKDEKFQKPADEAQAAFSKFGEQHDLMQVGEVWLDESFFLGPAEFCHQPLYFEEVNLERYGTSSTPRLQPVVSGVRFLATVPALPYLMTIKRPRACWYDGSPYLAGRPAPWHKELPPLRLNAATVEGLVAAGLILVIP